MRAIRWSIRWPTASELPSSCSGLQVRNETLVEFRWNPAKHTYRRNYHLRIHLVNSWSSNIQLFHRSLDRDGTPLDSPTPFRAPSPCARALCPSMSSTPTTRSRTLLFLSYRDSRASSSTSHPRYALDNDGDENERLIEPVKDHIAIDVGLPPKWSGCSQR